MWTPVPKRLPYYDRLGGKLNRISTATSNRDGEPENNDGDGDVGSKRERRRCMTGFPCDSNDFNCDSDDWKNGQREGQDDRGKERGEREEGGREREMLERERAL
ncbi:hypothetical protein L484_003833 [Morus notabilis]|uniref:Uncharacterized protein n=1 Tax=Morus notabilis TaxID=981085 RepID=W9QQ91_9ROSA|nr:hypothetical protein L484_003833 [Morus notabilis]